MCVCVCKNALERERGVYTHTGQRNMVKSFFFLSFTSERYNQILPYSYDLFFLVEETYHFFLFSSNQQHHLKFFKCVFFFLLHAHTLYTNKIDVAIKKKLFHSHTHAHAHSVVSIRSVLSHVTKGSVPHTHVRAVLLHAIVMWRLMILLGSSRHWDGLWRRRRRRRRRRRQ